MKSNNGKNVSSQIIHASYRVICMILGLDSTVKLRTASAPDGVIEELIENQEHMMNAAINNNAYHLCQADEKSTNNLLFRKVYRSKMGGHINFAAC